MRKILAFILSLVVIFAPVYSYAVLPIIATAASAAGRILLGNAVKKPTATAMRRGFIPCIGNIKAAMGCATLGLGIADLLRDKGYTVEEGDTINNNINIEIYKLAPPNSCSLSIAYSITNRPDNLTSPDAAYSNLLTLSQSGSYGKDYIFSPAENWRKPVDDYEKLLRADPYTKNLQLQWKSYPPSFQVYLDATHKESGLTRSDLSGYLYGYYKCLPFDSPKIYISDTELNTIIDQSLNNLTIDARKQLYKNIYNYDYSQHPNITINNNSTSGDSINNAIKNAPKEFEVSVELGDKINNNQVDMDDINDNTYNKNEEGQYDTPKGEEEGEEEGEDPQCPSDYIYNPVAKVCELVPVEEEQPAICSTNQLTQKFCDWISWTKEKPTPDVPTEVEIQEPEEIEIDEGLISLGASCPANTSFTINFMGQTHSFEFDNAPACQVATMISPFIMIAGTVSAIYTYSGASRGNGDDA